MSIVKTVSQSDFIDAFKLNPNREDSFSYEALEILFDYLEELSDDLGKNIEFDIVAFCCDYTEMSAEGILREYDTGLTVDDELEIYPEHEDILEYLYENTSVCGSYFDEEHDCYSYVFQQF